MRGIVAVSLVAAMVLGAFLPWAPGPMAPSEAPEDEVEGTLEPAAGRLDPRILELMPHDGLWPAAGWAGPVAFAWRTCDNCGGFATSPYAKILLGVVGQDGSIAVTSYHPGDPSDAANCAAVREAFEEAARSFVFQWPPECRAWAVLGAFPEKDWQVIRARLANWTEGAQELGSLPQQLCVDCPVHMTSYWHETCTNCTDGQTAQQDILAGRPPPVGWPLLVRDDGGLRGSMYDPRLMLTADDPRVLIDLQLRALGHWADPSPPGPWGCAFLPCWQGAKRLKVDEYTPRAAMEPASEWPGGIAYAWEFTDGCGGLGSFGCNHAFVVLADDGTIAVTSDWNYGSNLTIPNCRAIQQPIEEAGRHLRFFLPERACSAWGVLGRIPHEEWEAMKLRLQRWVAPAWSEGHVLPPHIACIDCSSSSIEFWNSTCEDCGGTGMEMPVWWEAFLDPEAPATPEPGRPLSIGPAYPRLGDDDARMQLTQQGWALIAWSGVQPPAHGSCYVCPAAE